MLTDLPGGPVVKDLPSSAGDVGSIPGQRIKIPDAAGQVSPTTREKLEAATKTRYSRKKKEGRKKGRPRL